MNAPPVSAQALFQNLEGALEARWIGGGAGADRVLWPPLEAGASLYGRLNWIQPARLQLIGPEESAFLDRLEPAVRDALIRDLLDSPIGALLVCGNLEQAATLRAAADAAAVPLWQTPATPAIVLEWLGTYRHSLSASTVVHGELLEVFGLGVLITGGSGIGKSELALELLSRGHRLIADDTPTLTRVAPNVLEGTCPPTLVDLLEVRGLGILNIRRMFGDSAIKRNKRIRLIVHLAKQEEIASPAEARLQGLRETRVILGVGVPAITLPIAPGRNLAVLLECAVRDHILRLSGYQAEQDLMARMEKAMTGATSCG
jgi:HPr kinase/phosphorylase